MLGSLPGAVSSAPTALIETPVESSFFSFFPHLLCTFWFSHLEVSSCWRWVWCCSCGGRPFQFLSLFFLYLSINVVLQAVYINSFRNLLRETGDTCWCTLALGRDKAVRSHSEDCPRVAMAAALFSFWPTSQLLAGTSKCSSFTANLVELGCRLMTNLYRKMSRLYPGQFLVPPEADNRPRVVIFAS